MTKYSILIILFLFQALSGFGQDNKLEKNIQSWRVEVANDATKWSKKKNISSLTSAQWKIKQDSISTLQIENPQAIKRLLSDKRTVVKLNLLNGSSPLVLNREKLYKSVHLQIEDYAKKELEGDRVTLIKNLKKSLNQSLPNFYDEGTWDIYLPKASMDSILPAFKNYVIKAKSITEYSRRDSVKINQKFSKIEEITAIAIEKSKNRYNAIIKTNNIQNSNYKFPDIPWNFDISDLVKSSTSWSASDITVSLERKNVEFMRIAFDTLQATLLTNMPLADSALCSGNLIENEIAKGRESNKFTPCGLITGFDCYGKFSPTFWEKEKFVLRFDKNVTEDIQGSLAPAYNYLKSNKLELKKVSILAYASIEGETEKNLKLAEERAAVMVKALQSREKDSIEAEIISSENWKDFYKDLPTIPFAKKWKELDSLQIKALVNDTANSRILEPWLKKHRYAILEVTSQRKMSESEKMDRIKEQYKVYISNMNSAYTDKRVYWESKVAAMRNWLVKEYMAGRISKSYADSLFKDMTPELHMVDFYQQLKVLQSNKELLGAKPEQWMLSIINSATKRHEELDNLLMAGTLKNSRPTELQDEAMMDFIRFSLVVTVNLVRQGKLPASIYNSLDLPQREEYIPFNAILDYEKNNTGLVVIDKKRTPVIKFSEQHDYSPDYNSEFQLPNCTSIYCKEDLYYPKLKAAILNPKKMTKGNKELMKKVMLIFLEIQISETNEWRGYYYDSDLDIFKVRKMVEELNLDYCPLQRDKVTLEVNRKAALFLFRKDKKNKFGKEMSAISSYYVRQKAFVSPELAERITRMLLWFDSEASNSKNNLYAAQSFLEKMGVGTDKRYDSLIPLLKRINMLANKFTLIGGAPTGL